MPRKQDPAALATELRLVLGQLIRRLRGERASTLTFGHSAVLARLDREGPQSVSDLAAGEHVRPQSMAQTVKDMEEAGLVTRRDDPDDRRRAIVEPTTTGQETLTADRRQRQGWLASGIADDLTAEERDVLARALPILRRLADR